MEEAAATQEGDGQAEGVLTRRYAEIEQRLAIEKRQLERGVERYALQREDTYRDGRQAYSEPGFYTGRRDVEAHPVAEQTRRDEFLELVDEFQLALEFQGI